METSQVIKEEEAKLAELAKEQKSKADSLSRLQLETEALIEVNKKASAEAKEEENRLETLKNIVSEEEKKVQPIRDEQEKASKELNDAQKEVFHVKQEIEAQKIVLKNIIAQSELARAEADKRQKTADADFEAVYAEKNARITALESKISELGAQVNTVESTIASKQALIAPLEAQIASLQSEIARLDTLLESNQDALAGAISAQKGIADTIGAAKEHLDLVDGQVRAALQAKIDAESELAVVKAELDGKIAERIMVVQQREDLDTREKYLKDLYQKAGISW